MLEMAVPTGNVNGEPVEVMDGATCVIHKLNSPDLETPVDEVAVTL